MTNWFVPGVYIVVYLDRRVEGHSIVKRVDLRRPHTFGPVLRGPIWRYLRRRMRIVDVSGISTILNADTQSFVSNGENFATTIDRPVADDYSRYVQLVKASYLASYLTDEYQDVKEIAQHQVSRAVFDPEKFYSDTFRIDLGQRRLHEYCIMGGTNRYVEKALLKDSSQPESYSSQLSKLKEEMDKAWHERLAQYIGIVLWSKLKVNPVLGEALVDDWNTAQEYSSERRKKADNNFALLVANAVQAFSRRPI